MLISNHWRSAFFARLRDGASADTIETRSPADLFILVQSVIADEDDQPRLQVKRPGHVTHLTIMSSVLKTPGSLSGKFIRSLAVARGDAVNAAAYAAGSRWPRVADALKAVVTGMTMGEQGEALAAVRSDFMEVVRQQSVLDRLTKVPFGVRGVAGTGGIGAAFLAEGDPTPVSASSFNPGPMLTPHRCAGIAVISSEVVRSSAVSDAAIVSPLASAIATTVDRAFLDPTNSGADAAPTSVTYSIGPAPSIEEALNLLATQGSNFASVVAVMNPHAALRIGFLAGPDARVAYNTVRVTGGTLFGIPVLVTPASPAGQVTFLDGNLVRVALDDPEVMTSGDAAIAMEDAPSAGDTNLVSMFATNSYAIRAVRFCDWYAHPTGVAFTVLEP